MIGTVAIAMLMQGAAATAPADYTLPQNWLCYPGRRDVCSAPDYEATVMEAGTQPRREAFVRAEEPAADCFYVYPTVSLDEGGNSDLVINDEERYVVEAQFARFGSACRQFAPLYRQRTLTNLRGVMSGQPERGDRDLAYADVQAAFQHYIRHENDGRPFVLYGHSQGTSMLKRLIAEEVEGTPLEDQLLSAMLIGINVGVEPGSDTGEFQLPLCRSADQTGCIVSWVTFREDDPPGEEAFFGRWRDEENALPRGYEVACTNPADLAQNRKQALGAAFPTRRNRELAVDTPVLAAPGLLEGQCVNEEGASYLSVSYDPSDPQRSQVAEGVMAAARGMPGWGLHMVDANVAQDDLIRLVESQAQAWEEQ